MTGLFVNLRPSALPFVGGAAAGHNPAASTTYRFGLQPLANPGTTDPVLTLTATRQGRVRRVTGFIKVTGTLASAGSITVRVRNVTQGTTQDITTTLDATAALNTFENQTMSLALSRGDQVCIEFVTPAWVTAPTATYWSVTVEM